MFVFSIPRLDHGTKNAKQKIERHKTELIKASYHFLEGQGDDIHSKSSNFDSCRMVHWQNNSKGQFDCYNYHLCSPPNCSIFALR